MDLDSSKNVTTERQTFYCIPVPGESSWVKSISSRNTGAPTLAVDPVNSASGSQKRKFDCVESAQPADMECDTNPDTSDDGAKHLKPEQSNGGEDIWLITTVASYYILCGNKTLEFFIKIVLVS